MKKVLVIGASGRTGNLIVKRLLKTDWQPIAGVHSPEKLSNFENQGVTGRIVDVHQTVKEIALQLHEIDAIIYAAGGGVIPDLDGKVKMAQAAQTVGIKRFILISAGGIQHFHDEKRLEWMNEFEEYSINMYYGDMYILNSGLDYTIIRPEHLTDEKGSEKVEIGSYLPHDNISRDNVAAVAVASLGNRKTIKTAFDVADGAKSILKAIDSMEEDK